MFTSIYLHLISFQPSFSPVIPSVSLLQKTSSSPVSCHATGFYPERAVMFFRKDEEEIHEGVDPGDILTNNDEIFQTTVDLNVSSVTPDNWRRYDCVFELSGVKNIITNLDKTVIRFNRRERTENPSDMTASVIAAVFVVLIVIVIAAVGFAVYNKKKAPENSIELSVRSSGCGVFSGRNVLSFIQMTS
ncbi:major histocompatibility complex class I-related gene protein-like [Simochromis diagramma]|uniref:major histocompatibility complex class I-related gene protein-like n=1 Tax=Simochromis diagramma TaxID=43689 RepID=UPI001A7E943A|nr:major histocompatibility complex class I-related gene protein-like [Simochromis diagramma]